MVRKRVACSYLRLIKVEPLSMCKGVNLKGRPHEAILNEILVRIAETSNKDITIAQYEFLKLEIPEFQACWKCFAEAHRIA